MQNTKLMLASLTFVGLFALAGCSFPGVYKVDIQQGNVVTQDMIDQLRPGMTRQQVRFIMGNPLITDTFHPNRWDYLYSIQPGGSQRQQERVSLVFNANDQLAGLAGDFMPGVSRDEQILGRQTQAPSAPAATPGRQHLPQSRHLAAQVKKELHDKKKEMALIIEQSNIAYEARDQAHSEMALLKAQADKEQSVVSRSMLK